MVKDNTIIVKWSKREDDILYTWGDGIPKCDVSLVNCALSYNVTFSKKDSYHGLIKELEARGYDITTFRLTIKKKEEKCNQLK